MPRRTMTARYGAANVAFLRTKYGRGEYRRLQAGGATETGIRRQLTILRNKIGYLPPAERTDYTGIEGGWAYRDFRNRHNMMRWLESKPAHFACFIQAQGVLNPRYGGSDAEPDTLEWRSLCALRMRNTITDEYVREQLDLMFTRVARLRVRWRP